MTVVELTFVAGRYHGTPWGRHVNEGLPEWPPSPWRLLRALVACWKRALPDVTEEQMRSLLDKLAEPPSFCLPPAVQACTRHYMPTNKKTTLVFDNFVLVDQNTKAYVVWKQDLPPDEQRLLSALFAQLCYLGRAESWVDARVVDDSPNVNCFPTSWQENTGQWESVRVLAGIGDSNLLEALCMETTELRRSKRLEPPASIWIDYQRSRNAFVVTPLSSIPSRNDHPTLVRFALTGKPLPQVTDALPVGETTRRAVMALYGRQNDGEASPVLSGKDEYGQPLTGHLHAHYLAEDHDGDGRLDRLTVFAPQGLDSKALRAVTALRRINLDKTQDPVSAVLLGTAHRDRVDAKVWRSITPFVLGRYPKFFRSGLPKLRDDGRQVDGPIDEVYREWEIRRQADPDLPRLLRVEHEATCQLPGRKLSWLQFRSWRRKRSVRGPGSVWGFRVEFERPLAGPIALGYGCHFGLGQFVPVS